MLANTARALALCARMPPMQTIEAFIGKLSESQLQELLSALGAGLETARIAQQRVSLQCTEGPESAIRTTGQLVTLLGRAIANLEIAQAIIRQHAQ
jgi:hypothetical protein